MPTLTCFQHIDCEGPGTLAGILKSKGVDLQIVQPVKGEAIPDSLGDGLVILGGPMGVYDDAEHPWILNEVGAIQKALESKLPVLGICLGSQMLARAAKAQVFQGAQPEVGWAPVRLTPDGTKDGLFLGMPSEMTVFHWHGDTFTLPPGATHLAWSDLYRYQAFRIGTNAYGIQFHLEITREMAKDWMQKYARELTAQGGVIQPGRITENLDTHIGELKGYAETVFTRFAALL